MDEKFRKKSIEEFAEELGSGKPTPGGGAAAALESALGSSLVMMVANHTIGKPKYAEFEELNKDVLAEAEAIRDRLLAGMDRDAEAFAGLLAAWRMPEGSDKDAVMFSASVEATEAPLAVMEDSLAALRLAATLMGRSNANLESDLLAAAHSLTAGLQTAAVNVEANIPAIKKEDEVLAGSLCERKDQMVSEAGVLFYMISD